MYKYAFIFIGIVVLVLIQSFIHLPLTWRNEKGSKTFNGKAPSLFAENQNVYMSFASGDSIFYSRSSDKGKTFSAPRFVAVLVKLGLGGGRGPQIISVKSELMIAAANDNGNIYTYIQRKNTHVWEKGGRINDVPDIAKEGFVSLASNSKGELFAVWLDLREDHKNKIVGAGSKDGGRTWSKNKIIYRSPDSTVCECCKPSVVMKDQLVVVMFRNFLKGNRDLHLIQSRDRGKTFGDAQKLGEGSWKLNGCPMDGGGLVINNDNSIHTVWRRQGNIYSCEAGKKEELIAVGKQCVITGNNNNQFISFMNNGKVYSVRPDGTRIELGNGGSPQLVATGETSAFCAWENNGNIYTALLNK